MCKVYASRARSGDNARPLGNNTTKPSSAIAPLSDSSGGTTALRRNKLAQVGTKAKNRPALSVRYNNPVNAAGEMTLGPRSRFAQAWAPCSTAVWTARAMRAPQVERGPPKSSSGPWSRTATQTASEAVPVHGKPASSSAWDLASVTVMTALTRAASRHRDRHGDDDVDRARDGDDGARARGRGALGGRGPGGDAQADGRRRLHSPVGRPDVTGRPRPRSSCRRRARPGPARAGGRPGPSASSRRRPGRSAPTRAGPMPPPSIAEEIIRQPGPNSHSSDPSRHAVLVRSVASSLHGSPLTRWTSGRPSGAGRDPDARVEVLADQLLGQHLGRGARRPRPGRRRAASSSRRTARRGSGRAAS